eukprot:6134050-Pleurochrysis_carterae.AAC.1
MQFQVPTAHVKKESILAGINVDAELRRKSQEGIHATSAMRRALMILPSSSSTPFARRSMAIYVTKRAIRHLRSWAQICSRTNAKRTVRHARAVASRTCASSCCTEICAHACPNENVGM